MFRKFFRLPSAALLGLAAVVPAANAAIIVTEVDANGSSQTYGDDWIELTNTGASAVSIGGWKIDDSSGSGGSGSAGTIGGVTTIGAGQSAVLFMETSASEFVSQSAAFISKWFGAAGAPAGFLFGYVDGNGLGLGAGSGGDGVYVFNASNVLQTFVSFGGSDANKTFDNAAGLTNTTITTKSNIGTNGAFQAANGTEIGSPGTIGASPVPLPAAAWLLISGIGALGAAGRRRRKSAA